MGAVPKQLLPQRARILWRTPVKVLTLIAHNLNMSTNWKACLSQTDHQLSRKGRPKRQEFSINDAVKLVSDFLNDGQSMPSLSEFLIHARSSCDVLSFVVYTKYVLINFSQVIDKELPYKMAISACELTGIINPHALSYHVRKERKRKSEESRPIPPALEGFTVVTTLMEEDDDEATATTGEVSPLTEATDASELSGAASTTTGATTTLNSGRVKKKSRRSPRQAGEARLDAKLEREELNHRYKEAFKQATTLMADPLHDETVCALIKRMNAKHSLIGTKKILTRSTLYRAVSTGSHGERSPAKKGPPPKIPDILLEIVAAHAQVSLCSDGEMRGREIKRLMGAAVQGTEFDGAFKIESAFRKLLREFPAQLQPANKMSVDDARAQWTTFDNLQQWFVDAKKDLIETGLVIDEEVRDANGVLVSELDFRSDEVRRRIINMDETHHDLSITGDRAGPRAVMYHNPSLQRGCKRGVKSSRHVTGVYATNAAGESMPPMYIFDSGAKFEDNFQVRLQWLDGLPVTTGRYGCPERIECGSFYSVRSHGSMDDSLLNDYINQVILPLYPNISKTAAFDPTGKLLHGPVILKLDSGPGRIVASYDSILRREALAEMGLIIMAGLPNATSVQQEMDVLYGAFKSATYARGEEVLMEKMRKRGATARNTDARVAAAAAGSILSLGFEDLAVIVNGRTDDDISKRPFDKCFTEEKILQAWCKVGFVPFTRNCLSSNKVRHELGQSSANLVLEDLQDHFDSLVSAVEVRGVLNEGIFDVTIPVSRPLRRIEDDDGQVQQLLAQKGAFSASALWNTCGTRIGNARVALRAQREQIALNDAKITRQSQGRLDRQAKLLQNAQAALEKYNNGGGVNNALNEKDWGDVVRWVLPEAKVPGLMRDLKKKDVIIAKLNTLERDWTTYIPIPTAL